MTVDALTAAELQAMADTVATFLPDDVVISRRTGTSDGMGSYTGTWSTVASVKGRLSAGGGSAGGGEGVSAGRMMLSVPWMLAVPAGTDVTAKDRVAVLGHTHEVTDVLPGRTWELHLLVHLMRVDG